MNIADDKIQELKSLDIVDVAKHYLPSLKKVGSVWKCLSPFKDEKTPSFTVISNSTDNFFKCHSSDKSGDVIEFVKEIENTTFTEACKILADLSGIDLELKEYKPNNQYKQMQQNQQKPKTSIVKKSILSEQKKLSVQSYQKPNTSQQQPNKSVIEYFLSRGISEGTVKAFKITQSDHYFAQIGSKDTSINFNYYRAGELVNIKHRSLNKKAFGLEKGCELVLYNLDNVETNADHIFITEGECFTGDAEVLTPNGWIKLKDYSFEDVAQYNKSGRIEYVKPLAYIKKHYKDDLIELSNNQKYYSLTTKDHNLVLKTKKGEIIKKKAIDVYGKKSNLDIPRVANGNDNTGIDLIDDLIRLYIAVSADFTIRESGDIYGAFKKQRKVDRVTSLLDKLNIRYSANKVKNDYTSIFIHRNQGLKPFKLFPNEWYNMSTKQMQLVVEEILHWDGNSVPNRNQIEYSTKEYDNAKFIQTISHIIGYTSTIIKRKNKYGEWLKVSILFNKKHSNTQALTKLKIPHNDFVYCVQVPTGKLLIRQNECISISGNCDALALGEAYQSPKNIVSVPNGAGGTKKQSLSYLDSAVKSKVFDGKRLFLFFDNDQAGKNLTDAFIKRFGAHNCMIPTYPQDCKDINEVLVTYDVAGVQLVIDSLKYPNISGISDVSDFEHKIWDYWENGYPKGDKIGLEGFDNLLSFRGGELTMVTGISGSGKSEFLDYIMVELAKKENWRWAVCSMENPRDLHTIKVCEKYMNTNLCNLFNPETGEVYYDRADEKQLKEALVFSYNHFNYIEHATSVKDGEVHRDLMSIDYILTQAKALVSMYGTKGLVIDPWNTLDHEVKNNETETNYVSRILTKIIAFAEDYNVHVFLVAHPTKGVTVQGVDRVATLNDISGSGNFFNKTHNGISVFREKDRDKNPNNLVEVHVQKVKFKFIGNLGKCHLKYDKRTGNYTYTDEDYPQQ